VDEQIQPQINQIQAADENSQQPDYRYSDQPRLASFRLVFIGDYGYDIIVLFFFLLLLIVGSIFTTDGTGITSAIGVLNIVIIVMLAAFLQLIYRISSLYFFQTTPGMKLCGLTIISETGGKPSLGQLTKRELLKYFTYAPYLFTYWLMPQSTERTPHDLKAGTFVLFDGKERSIFFRVPTTKETYQRYVIISIFVIIAAIIYYYFDRSNPYP